MRWKFKIPHSINKLSPRCPCHVVSRLQRRVETDSKSKVRSDHLSYLILTVLFFLRRRHLTQKKKKKKQITNVPNLRCRVIGDCAKSGDASCRFTSRGIITSFEFWRNISEDRLSSLPSITSKAIEMLKNERWNHTQNGTEATGSNFLPQKQYRCNPSARGPTVSSARSLVGSGRPQTLPHRLRELDWLWLRDVNNKWGFFKPERAKVMCVALARRLSGDKHNALKGRKKGEREKERKEIRKRDASYKLHSLDLQHRRFKRSLIS